MSQELLVEGPGDSPVSETQTRKIPYKGCKGMFGCISLPRSKVNLGDLPAPSCPKVFY